MENFFKITPQNGVILANQREVFQVTFYPKSLDQYNYKAKLLVRDYDKVLTLPLTGKGVGTNVESIQTLDFTCAVGQQIEKMISIKNVTQDAWIIKPNIGPE